ncbi:MAG: DMT family transporter [Hyphomicrobiales bacterium]
MRNTPALKDWAALATLVVFWGSSYALTKTAVSSIPPDWVVAGRMSIAALILVPACFLSGRRLPSGALLWACIAWLAIAGTMLPFYLISWGTQHIPSAVAGVLMGVTPLWTIALAHIALPDEKLNRFKLAGFVLGFAGVVTMFDPRELLSLSSAGLAFWGQLAVIGGTMCFAMHSISARLMPRVAPLEMSAAVALVGSVASCTFAMMHTGNIDLTIDTASLWSVVALGVFPTALASIVLYFLLASAGASFVSYTNYLLPGYALLLGVLVLRETLPANAYIGLGLIMAGIAVSQFRRQRPSTPEQYHQRLR